MRVVTVSIILSVSGAVALQSQANSVEFRVWPQQTEVQMPVPGVIKSAPPTGTVSVSSLDTLDAEALTDPWRSADLANLHLSALTFSPTGSEVTESVLGQQLARLSNEVTLVRRSLMTHDDPLLSSPSTDPLAFGLATLAERRRLDQIRAAIVALLWDVDLGADKPQLDPYGIPMASLENRVRATINEARLRFAAVVAGADVETVRKAAPRVLADETRKRRLIKREDVVNVQAPFQRLWINDYSLHSGAKQSALPVGNILAEYTRYCNVSARYWTQPSLPR